jgi:hypothetical protein
MCIDEETLELYILGRLPEQDVEGIEDHLMVCKRCQELAGEVIEATEAIQKGLRELSAKTSGNVISIRGDKPPTDEDN